MKEQTQYTQGKHPNSLANLKKTEGRTPDYDSRKKRRNITVTDEGWSGFEKLAKKYGVSKSDIVERIGRGEIKLQIPV